jgi:hypothetical protein
MLHGHASFAYSVKRWIRTEGFLDNKSDVLPLASLVDYYSVLRIYVTLVHIFIKKMAVS